MEIGWILGGFFAFMLVIFIAVAVLFPEMVGIQGKKAKEIEASHRQNTDDKNLPS